MGAAVERRKMRTTPEARRDVAVEARSGFAPFHQQIEVLPGLSVIMEAKSYPLPPKTRAGWVSIQIGASLLKIAFRFITSWDRVQLKCLVAAKLGSLIMRTLHGVFMQAKCEGKIEYFRIHGMFFDSFSGFDTEYRTY